MDSSTINIDYLVNDPTSCAFAKIALSNHEISKDKIADLIKIPNKDAFLKNEVILDKKLEVSKSFIIGREYTGEDMITPE